MPSGVSIFEINNKLIALKTVFIVDFPGEDKLFGNNFTAAVLMMPKISVAIKLGALTASKAAGQK
jgi:hypothetical protein